MLYGRALHAAAHAVLDQLATAGAVHDEAAVYAAFDEVGWAWIDWLAELGSIG